MMKAARFAVSAAFAAALGLGSFSTADGGPLCSSLTPDSIGLAAFESCVVEGQNDHLPDVQTALDFVLNPDVDLDGLLSFSPGPESAGTEFGGDNAGAGFDVNISAPNFTFVSLPPGTLFVTIKQGPDFEIFGVQGNGGLPFTVQHQLNDSVNASFSHFSTFGVAEAAVPEPGTLLLLGSGLVGVGAFRRRYFRRPGRSVGA